MLNSMLLILKCLFFKLRKKIIQFVSRYSWLIHKVLKNIFFFTYSRVKLTRKCHAKRYVEGIRMEPIKNDMNFRVTENTLFLLPQQPFLKASEPQGEKVSRFLSSMKTPSSSVVSSFVDELYDVIYFKF
jgi:hypothetical protein